MQPSQGNGDAPVHNEPHQIEQRSTIRWTRNTTGRSAKAHHLSGVRHAAEPPKAKDGGGDHTTASVPAAIAEPQPPAQTAEASWTKTATSIATGGGSGSSRRRPARIATADRVCGQPVKIRVQVMPRPRATNGREAQLSAKCASASQNGEPPKPTATSAVVSERRGRRERQFASMAGTNVNVRHGSPRRGGTHGWAAGSKGGRSRSPRARNGNGQRHLGRRGRYSR